MIQRNRGRPRTSYTDGNRVIVESFLREDGRVKFVKRIVKTVVQCLTSLGQEHYRKGMVKLVKRWDKCLNVNGDYAKK
jgi:hypothetical protein